MFLQDSASNLDSKILASRSFSSDQTSQTRLPPELFDAIIDECHSDKPALINFSLVSKDWLSSSRYHLFSTLELDDENALLFLEILDSPLSTIIPDQIRRLNMSKFLQESLLLDDVLNRLGCLQHIQSMVLTFRYRTALMHSSRTILQHNFSTLTHFALIKCNLANFSDFIAIMCSFPALQELEYKGHWANKDSASLTGYRPSLTLQSLNVDCQANHLLPWLLSTHEPLSTLRLYCIIFVEVPYIAQYLAWLGPSLQHLYIDLLDEELSESLMRAVNLGANTQLTYLGFGGEHTPIDIFEIIPRMLCQVESSVMEVVEFTFWDVSHEELATLPWEDIQGALARPSYERLQSLRICLIGGKCGEYMAYIRRKLPVWHRRGVLRFFCKPLPNEME